MLSVFLQNFRAYRVGLLAVSAGVFAVSMVIVYTFEAFGGMEAFEDLFELVPAPIAALFRAQGGFATTPTGYIAADYRHPFYIIAGVAFVVTVASGASAREVERGTALMLLASPIARWRYLTAKLGVLIAGAVVIVLATWLGTFAGAALTGLGGDIDNRVLLLVQLNMLGLVLAAGGITALISAASSDGGQTVVWSAGVVTTMYLVDFLSLIWSPAGPAGPLTLFHYYDPLGLARSGEVPWRDLIVLFGVAAAGFGGALVVFQRRDIAR